jgi:hypothetical protein
MTATMMRRTSREIAPWAAGETGSDTCPACAKPVRTRQAYRTVQLRRTRLRVPHVLVDICAECNGTIAVSREAMAQFREAGVSK